MYKHFIGNDTRVKMREEIMEWNKNMRNVKTVRTYNSYQKQYVEYCKNNSLDHTHPCAEYVCKFLMHKYDEEQWTAASTFNQARSSIAEMYRYMYPDSNLGEHPLICTTIKNIAPHLAVAKQKAPITPNILNKIHDKISMNNEQHIKKYYMMLLMVAAYLRESEVVKIKTKNVNTRNIDEKVVLQIVYEPAKKQVQEEVTKYVQGAPNNPAMDIIQWHTKYKSLTITNSNAEYLFHTAGGEKMADTTAWHAFKQLFEVAGLDYSDYGSHSARRGGTTASYEAGVPINMIKMHGGWKSNAVERYIKPSTEFLLQTTNFLSTTQKQ